jgi:hypothetical protein
MGLRKTSLLRNGKGRGWRLETAPQRRVEYLQIRSRGIGKWKYRMKRMRGDAKMGDGREETRKYKRNHKR